MLSPPSPESLSRFSPIFNHPLFSLFLQHLLNIQNTALNILKWVIWGVALAP